MKQDMRQMKEIQLQGAYFSFNSKRVTLHRFADASNDSVLALLLVSAHNDYCREQRRSNCIRFRKTKICLKKKLSFPELELQAATIATRLMNNVQQERNYESQQTCMWFDSNIASSWGTLWKSYLLMLQTMYHKHCSRKAVKQWRHIRGDILLKLNRTIGFQEPSLRCLAQHSDFPIKCYQVPSNIVHQEIPFLFSP